MCRDGGRTVGVHPLRRHCLISRFVGYSLFLLGAHQPPARWLRRVLREHHVCVRGSLVLRCK